MWKQVNCFIVIALVSSVLMSGCSASDDKSMSKEDVAALLGVDANDNGVRDSIEKRIYSKYKRPVEQALMMQHAKWHQKVLLDPIAAAKSVVLDQELFNVEACEGYLGDHYDLNINEDYGSPVQYLEDAFYNTKERKRVYKKFNRGKGGGSYSVPNPWRNFVESACDFDVAKMIDKEPYIIEGIRLPPDPRELSKTTLMGVDSNSNGVRDDVERWIYTTYAKPIENAVLIQRAKAYQIVIEDPDKALETKYHLEDATDCELYWTMSVETATKRGEKFSLLATKKYQKELDAIQFDTKDRYLAYERYKTIANEKVQRPSLEDDMKSKCEFNVSEFTSL